jgi:hypothetical protein
MMSNLQRMCVDCLAQHECDGSQHYTPAEYRALIKAFDRLIEFERNRRPKRWRLRYFVQRVETWSKAFREWRKRRLSLRQFQEWRRTKATIERLKRLRETSRWRRPKRTEKNPTALETKKTKRRFDPYRDSFLKRQAEKSHRNRRWSGLSSTPPREPRDLRQDFSITELVEEYVLARPLRLEFTVQDELEMPLETKSSYLVHGAVRLRYMLASTGVVIPGVLFGGNSSRLDDTVGLLLSDTEWGNFRLMPDRYYPLPAWLLCTPSHTVEGVSCLPIGQRCAWPLHELDSARQSLLHLMRLVSQNLQILISREALLWDVTEPDLPSAKFLALARQYVRNGRPIPRGSFLELSMRLLGDPQKPKIRLPSETKNLPCFVAVTQTPIPFFQKIDIVFLCLSLVGPPDHPVRQRVAGALSPRLQQRLASMLRLLNPEIDAYTGFLEYLSETKEWMAHFGPSQYTETTGHVLIERLLASEPRIEPEMPPQLAASCCADLAERDPAWFCLAILSSHFEERSTPWKLRRFARRSPARLARLMERFMEQPVQRYFMPLEKLSILCRSLGTQGLEMESYLSRYLPPLPSVSVSPQEVHKVQLEMLRRTRYWAARGVQHSDL